MTIAHFDVVLDSVHAATMRDETGYGAIRDAAIGIRRDRIEWIGAATELSRDISAARRIDCHGRWATPGLIDCHTHLVYAGNRADEFEQRLRTAACGARPQCSADRQIHAGKHVASMQREPLRPLELP